MPEGRLAHTSRAERALIREAHRLVEGGDVGNLEEGLRVACSTLDGAADKPGETVESVQTCTDLFAEKVLGLTAPDTVTRRTDQLAKSEGQRLEKAETGSDEVEKWLKEHDPQYSKVKKRWGR